MLGVN